MSRKKNAELRLLRRFAKSRQVSLGEAMKLCSQTLTGPEDFHPLALLLEAGYVGATMPFNPPAGAEKMREFNTARMLYVNWLPRNDAGEAVSRESS